MTSLMTVNQHKIENDVITPSLKRETIGKLINRIPGSALRMHVETLGKPRDVNKSSQSLAW